MSKISESGIIFEKSITRPILKLQPPDFHGNRSKWNLQDDNDDDDDDDDDNDNDDENPNWQ